MNRMLHRYSLLFAVLLSLTFVPAGLTQTNEWQTQYVTFDDAINGTGNRTSSVAVVGLNRFVALVARTPSIQENLFEPSSNYLVGYWDADSADGIVDGTGESFTNWESGLDLVQLLGAWQIAGGKNNYVYVANNDENHNILVFELTADGTVSTDYRMETGTENIFGIEVDTAGYVYVADYEGRADKDNEIKVYAGINAPGTQWGDFTGHQDEPITTIDLPEGIYQGLTVSDDGTMLFVSATSERSIWKYVGDPVNGYELDDSFSITLAPSDTISDGLGTESSFLGLAYYDSPPTLFAAVDSFAYIGSPGGYNYARIYQIDALTAVSEDTIDIAEWNLAVTGDYSTGSSHGRAGGFASVMDVDIDAEEVAVYTQTYYGWAVEKWVADGVVNVEESDKQLPETISLSQNYPNPFNPSTTIAFDLKQTEHVKLSIYNLLGQEVATLINQTLNPGSHQVTFTAGNAKSGIYFYKLEAGAFSQIKKMVLTK